MPYYSPKDPYNRYAFLRWWCQNQWWIQIVVPCIICAGVIGALLYQWNNEHQRQVQDKIFETQYGYMKTHPPELDPELDEKAAAWRVIRMKKNDPSMPIPYKKKQLIVKHWKSIIVDMKAEEIQRLHDLLQDQPVKPTDDVEIDISKFDAPWKDDVSLEDMDSELPQTEKDGSDQTVNPSENEEAAKDNPTPADNSKSPEKTSAPEKAPEAASDNKISDSPAPEVPDNTASDLANKTVPEAVEPILLDSQSDQTPVSGAAEETAPVDNVSKEEALPNIDVNVSDQDDNKTSEKSKKLKKKVTKSPAIDEVGPLEDNFLQQREDFIKKALEERNRKIEEFKKSQDPYQFIPTPWKRNPLVI